MSEKKRILIAYDGSTFADDAIGDLPRAGMPREAEALIVHIQEKWLPPPGYDFVGESAAAKNAVGARTAHEREKPPINSAENYVEMLEKAATRLNSYFPEWTAQNLNLKVSPAREIIRQAREWNADLIVVGCHGRTGNNRIGLGSVSQKIVNEAGCSVRVVRGQAWKNGSPSRLLIGLDGTSGSRAAVEEVARRMWIMGSEVRLVVAQDAAEKDAEWLREYIEEARKRLERAELSVTELIEAGDPKRVIVAAAEEWGADCIFLGANDSENFNENLLLGSVSTAVVARAHCTVEIVRQK